MTTFTAIVFVCGMFIGAISGLTVAALCIAKSNQHNKE